MTAVLGWRSSWGGRTAARTLARMRELVNQDVERPALWELAPRIVRDADGRDYQRQAQLLHDWLASHTQFIRDPIEDELLRTPAYMLALVAAQGVAQGDCDDVAMLAAALCKAVGFRCRFIAEAYDPGKDAPFVHVYTIALTPDGWRNFDTTRPAGVDVAPTRRLTVEV